MKRPFSQVILLALLAGCANPPNADTPQSSTHADRTTEQSSGPEGRTASSVDAGAEPQAKIVESNARIELEAARREYEQWFASKPEVKWKRPKVGIKIAEATSESLKCEKHEVAMEIWLLLRVHEFVPLDSDYHIVKQRLFPHCADPGVADPKQPRNEYSERYVCPYCQCAREQLITLPVHLFRQLKIPPIHGAVIGVSKKVNQVMINVGEKDGVEIGFAFDVQREDTSIGVLVVEKVYPKKSACRWRIGNMKYGIQEGDRVVMILFDAK